MRALLLAVASASLLACDGSSAGPDPALPDAAGPSIDAADIELDAPPSSGVPLAGFGDLAGMCGVLNDPELTGASPSAVHVTLTFQRRYNDPADRNLLTEGGARMMATPNAGGSSALSEAFAYEELARCELAPLLHTETEIMYDTTGKITDLEVVIDGHKIGVSVTRAFAYPLGTPYTLSAAQTLLTRKLEDIKASTMNVSAADRWTKQILAYLSYDDQSTAILDQAWAMTDAATKADTILLVITTGGDDAFIYTNN
ncbi:MAG: hypothetical protein HOV81_38860 [Kofleriaceae bacterium]|nr:hypothetical protein [Kofleriaceae bacterium]